DGEMVALWATGRAGRPGALEALLRLVEKVDAEGADLQKTEIRLYAADACTESRPNVAWTYCREARALDLLDDNVRLRNLLDRVERSLAAGPIRFGPHGELILDLSRGWPDFDATIDTVRRFLIFEAVRQSKGNRSDAARKLGLTRSRLHDIWRQLHGEPPRPRRDESVSDGPADTDSREQDV